MIKKVESFKIVQAPGGSVSPSIEIILVHGFKSSRTRSSRLEKWLKNAISKHVLPTVRASAFAFDEADVLSKGVDELQRVSDKLLEKIRLLKSTEKTSPVVEESPQKKSTHFLYIAHGFGAWVVRNGLARIDNLDLSHVALGVIFLDNPNEESGPVRNLDGDFSPSDKIMPDLKIRLLEVKRDWDSIRTPQYVPWVTRYEIWSIKYDINTVLKRNTSSRRLSRMIGRSSAQFSHSPKDEDELGKVFDEIIPRVSARPATSSPDQISPEAGSSSDRPYHLSKPTQASRIDPNHHERGGSSTKFDDDHVPTLPDTRLHERRRSFGAVSDGRSNRESVSSINDEQNVSRLSTNELPLPEGDKVEFLKFANLARQYLRRGDLDNAYFLYERCEAIMKRFRMTDTVQHVQIRMQMAITLLQKGRYGEAEKQLKLMRGILSSKPGMIENDVLKHEIELELELWFATSLIRRGRNTEAKDQLEQLLTRRDLVPSDLSIKTHVLVAAKVRRLLSLANAYLGDYDAAFSQIDSVYETIALLEDRSQSPEATGEPSAKNSETLKIPITRQPRFLACEYNFQFTEAIVRLLWGDYVEGLKKATSAHRGFLEHWGRKHFRTLEVASLVALLRAYNSDSGKAETLCQDTLETMTKSLGDVHPLTLQNMDVLVYIFRTQSRFVEAVDTSKSLCKKVEISLGPEHPQTLRSKCQLGIARLSCGDYKSAERILEQVTQTACKTFGGDHPDTLRFQSELAQAYCRSWKMEPAKDLAVQVIFKQRHIYTIGRQKGMPSQQYPKETPLGVMLKDLLKDVAQDIKTLRIHPDLLFTMQLLAKIESKQPSPDWALVQEIHEAVWKGRKDKLGVQHTLSLVSQFELAATFRELGDLKRAQQTFDLVAKERMKLLGPDHPDTLAARHEALVMEFTLGGRFDIMELKSIQKLREWQLGRCHPDALQSLLWIFAVQLLLEKETEAFDTAENLLYRLREDSVRKQRLIESLQVEEKVALFYAAQGYSKQSMEIFHDIAETIKQAEASADESLSLVSLRISASENLGSVKGKAVQA